jgi:hypothetical protein
MHLSSPLCAGQVLHWKVGKLSLFLCMLLQLELLLTALTLCVALVGVISGIFGMNLHNTHEDDYTAFILVSCSAAPCQSLE